MSALDVLRETASASGWRPERIGWKGIAQDVLDEAGVEELDDGRGFYVPYRLPDGSVLFGKRFGLDGASWYEPSPLDVGGLIPFGLESVPWERLREDDILFVAEGESDALCLRQHIAEMDRRRVFTLGLPGAHSWRESWLRYLRPFSAVYVIPDGDEPGNRMASKVRGDCPWTRIVTLPDGDDLRSFVQREGAEELLPLLAEATYLLKLAIGFRVCRSLPEMEAFMRKEMR